MNLLATSFYECQSLSTEIELLIFFGSFFGLGAFSLLIPLFIIFNPSQLMTRSRTTVRWTIQEELNIPLIPMNLWLAWERKQLGVFVSGMSECIFRGNCKGKCVLYFLPLTTEPVYFSLPFLSLNFPSYQNCEQECYIPPRGCFLIAYCQHLYLIMYGGNVRLKDKSKHIPIDNIILAPSK